MISVLRVRLFLGFYVFIRVVLCFCLCLSCKYSGTIFIINNK